MITALLLATIFVCFDSSGTERLNEFPIPTEHCRRLPTSGNQTGPRIETPLGDVRRYTRFDPIIRAAAVRYRVPIPLIRAVIRCESDYDPRAISRAGARGLMQILPDTAQAMGGLDVDDAHANVFAGVFLLRALLREFTGDATLALAAYNAGVAAIVSAHGVPPFAETRRYVSQVRWFWRRYDTIPNVIAASRPTPLLQTGFATGRDQTRPNHRSEAF